MEKVKKILTFILFLIITLFPLLLLTILSLDFFLKLDLLSKYASQILTITGIVVIFSMLISKIIKDRITSLVYKEKLLPIIHFLLNCCMCILLIYIVTLIISLR